jgi:RNA polymerase-associated protein RTF1
LQDSFLGDDEDRDKLERMTEREREEELFKRAERREELKKRSGPSHEHLGFIGK